MGLDLWSGMTDHTGMADHKQGAPDYDLNPVLPVEEPAQYKALFEETRLQIVELLLDRAATIKELADTLDKPKGTIGHHVSVLEEAGLIRVVRTEKVRAIEAKYYGRVARTYLLADKADVGFELAPDHFLQSAAAEFAQVRDPSRATMSTLRHVRIPDDRAREWVERLGALSDEFTSEIRGGETTYGLLLAFYPTDRPHLPGKEDGAG
jgi:DNA-binding transcriptional ArsR family regulator